MKRIVLLAMVALLMTACEKSVVLESDESEEQPTGTLIVRAGTLVDGNGETTEEATVSYPVNVYVMDSTGDCVALQQIGEAGEQLKMELPSGQYDVYAVAGADETLYDLPTMKTAKKETLLNPKDGVTHGDLMTASGNVVLSKGESNKLTLAMKRDVMLVETITMKSIPSDVTAVSVTLSPLHEAIRLDGEYTSGTSSHTFNLTKQADGSTWLNDTGTYLLGATDAVTVKISLTRNGETTSYSYKSSQKIDANYKVNITGTFNGNDDIALTGTIVGTIWEGEVTIDFDFDQTNATTPSGDDEPVEEVLHGDAPAAGTLYNSCYVLRTQSSGNSTIVTLMTLKEVNKLKYSTTSDEEKFQSGVKTACDEALETLAVTGVSGWRLPNAEEMSYLSKHVGEVNEKLGDIEADNPELEIEPVEEKKGAYECGYYFEDTDGDIHVMLVKSGDIETHPNPNRATYKVRGFTTVTFSD